MNGAIRQKRYNMKKIQNEKAYHIVLWIASTPVVVCYLIGYVLALPMLIIVSILFNHSLWEM